VHLRAGPYQPAVTTGIAFAGVAWANFLGPGHLEDFDRTLFEFGDDFTAQWRGEEGLFVFAGRSRPGPRFRGCRGLADLADRDVPPRPHDREVMNLAASAR